MAKNDGLDNKQMKMLESFIYKHMLTKQNKWSK